MTGPIASDTPSVTAPVANDVGFSLKTLDRAGKKDGGTRGPTGDGNRSDPRLSVADSPFTTVAAADSGGFISGQYGQLKDKVGNKQAALFLDVGYQYAGETARAYTNLNADFPMPKDGRSILDRAEAVMGFGAQDYIYGDEDDPKMQWYFEAEAKWAFKATPLDATATPVEEKHEAQIKGAAGLVMNPAERIAIVAGLESRINTHGVANGFSVQDPESNLPRTDNAVFGAHYKIGRDGFLKDVSIGADYRLDLHKSTDAAGNTTRAGQITARLNIPVSERMQLTASYGEIDQYGAQEDVKMLSVKGSFLFGG